MSVFDRQSRSMPVSQLYTKMERWFTVEAVRRGLVTNDQVVDAVKSQILMREVDGRCPKIWEILVLKSGVTSEYVESIFKTIGKSTDQTMMAPMLGRVLRDVGYVKETQLLDALNLQVEERRNGTWRMLGQILLEKRFITQAQLDEALDVLSQRRQAAGGAGKSEEPTT